MRLEGGRKRAAKRRLQARSPWCATCVTRGRYVIGTIRDHVIALADGGTEAEHNTQLLCVECHRSKSADEATRGRARAHGETARVRTVVDAAHDAANVARLRNRGVA